MVRMLGYDWGGSPSTTILPTPGAEPPSHHHHQPNNSQPNGHIFHPFNPQGSLVPAPTGATFYHHQANNTFYDPRAYVGAPTPFNHQLSAPPPPQANSSYPSGYFAVPKADDPGQTAAASRIGLNLGGRTYFSSAEDNFVNRLYGRRSRPMMLTEQAGAARCQADGCNADLSSLVKQYHRRHKVCEVHSKASFVSVQGLPQRFCQQCSRFHLLPEFDDERRSCRKRLADHNRRRRKSNSQPSGTGTQEISRSTPPLPPIQPEGAGNSPSNHLTVSPRESGVYPPSSAAVALSPPGMSLDCFNQRLYHQAANTATTSTGASSSSSSPFFFSTG